MEQIVINYRNIVDSSLEEVSMWNKWKSELSFDIIMNWLCKNYGLVIKDVYNVHFLTKYNILNIVLNIENDIDFLKTYYGSDKELLIMFSIVINEDKLYNLKRISNIINKNFIMRDIILNNII